MTAHDVSDLLLRELADGRGYVYFRCSCGMGFAFQLNDRTSERKVSEQWCAGCGRRGNLTSFVPGGAS